MQVEIGSRTTEITITEDVDVTELRGDDRDVVKLYNIEPADVIDHLSAGMKAAMY